MAMRRLVLLLLAIVGTFGLSPAAPAHVLAGGATAHRAPVSGGCHDEGQAATHVCVGCAVAPEQPVVPHVTPRSPAAPHCAAPIALFGRRTGFDPPPPRDRT
jgi:hypothetical protein